MLFKNIQHPFSQRNANQNYFEILSYPVVIAKFNKQRRADAAEHVGRGALCITGGCADSTTTTEVSVAVCLQARNSSAPDTQLSHSWAHTQRLWILLQRYLLIFIAALTHESQIGNNIDVHQWNNGCLKNVHLHSGILFSH